MNQFVDENEVMPDSLERFVIGVNDFKQSAGFWYSILALRVLPFLLYIVPVNVILGRINIFIMRFFLPDANLNGTPLLLMWIVVMLGLLALTIFLPKVATVIEFMVGFVYLFLAFHYHLYNTILGYTVLFSLITFLFIKFVFLMFEVIRLGAFAGDKQNNIERDETGRKVRSVNDEVVFTETDHNLYNDDEKPERDDEVYFTTTDLNEGNTPAIDDEVYFAGEEVEEGKAPVIDDEVYFVTEDANQGNTPLTDDDYFFG